MRPVPPIRLDGGAGLHGGGDVVGEALHAAAVFSLGCCHEGEGEEEGRGHGGSVPFQRR